MKLYFFLHRLKKTVQTSDIVIFYGTVFTMRSSVGMIQQNYNVIDRVYRQSV